MRRTRCRVRRPRSSRRAGPGRTRMAPAASRRNHSGQRAACAPVRRTHRSSTVRVAAKLHVETRGGDVGKIGGHDLRAAAVERERRNHHAPVAHGHQVRLTGLVCASNKATGSGRSSAGRQPSRARPRHSLTGRPPSSRRSSNVGCETFCIACGHLRRAPVGNKYRFIVVPPEPPLTQVVISGPASYVSLDVRSG